MDTTPDSFAGDRFAGAFSNGPQRSASPQSGGYGNSPISPVDTGHSPQSPSNATSPPNPAAVAAMAGLNPRSCVTCRRRKVKCDKRQPCSNCIKQHIECIFPRPGRAPRKTKKPPDAELLARLRRLEGVVQKLGRGANGEEITAEAAAAAAAAATGSPPDDRRPSTATTTGTDIPDEPPSLSNPSDNPRFKKPGVGFGGMLRIEKEMGKLVVGEGKSRYMSNTFWASLTDEVAEMRDLINQSSDSEEDEDFMNPISPDSPDSGSVQSRQTHQEFVFGYSSSLQTLRILHPPAKQVMTYWEIYVENVDPVVRILHKPTSRHLFALAARDPGELSKSAEALVFAVYFAAVTSMQPEVCQERLGVDRDTAIKRYRFATEQALSRAGFLSCQELVVVQAFTLLLACARRYDDNRVVWTLTGLLNRMAISIGLHRDGSHFNLSPFQTEMRRRCWWQVCTLDVRSSEDHAADPMVANTFFDVRMPLNINDDDIWPDKKEPPVEHEKCTEMTFDLVRYEIGGTIRMLSAAETTSNLPEQQLATLEAKDALLEKLRLRLEDKYLRHCDMTVPLQWVAANVARLVMAKIWLVIHHPFRKANHGSKISQETRDRTFLTSIDVISYSRMLWTQNKTSKWGWLFRTYFQWHAVAFLLSELCVRTTGPTVDEAWQVLDEALPEWEREDKVHRRSMMWKPIQKLIAKARRVRMEALQRQRAFPTDGTLGVSADWKQQQQQQQQQQRFQQSAAKGPNYSQQFSTPSSNASLTTNDNFAARGAPASSNTSPGVATQMNDSSASMGSFATDPAATAANTAANLQFDISQLVANEEGAPMSAPMMPESDQGMDRMSSMWMEDAFLMDNDTWDANQTPWDNVGLDPAMAFQPESLEFSSALWGQQGLGGTGF